MIENYKQYLIKHGYSEYTPSGNPSTVYDYAKRIERVCKREAVTIEQLASKIESYVRKYGESGSESDFGKRSNSAYINALKRFEEFNKISSANINKNRL